MSLIRQPVFIIIFGTNGTGKTTWLINRLSQDKRRQLVIDPDGMEKAWNSYTLIKHHQVSLVKIGAKVKITAPEEKEFQSLLKMRPGVLVLDDARYYIKSQIEQAVRQILVRRRQIAIDIFAVAHSLNEVPPTFWTYATNALVFKTADNPERSKKNIPRYNELLEVIKRVNDHPDQHYHEIFNLRK